MPRLPHSALFLLGSLLAPPLVASDDPPARAAERVELHLGIVAPANGAQEEALRRAVADAVGATLEQTPSLQRVWYADTDDRLLRRRFGLILRLRQKLDVRRRPLGTGKLTLKRRAPALAELEPLPPCDEAEVELDLFSRPLWSAATEIELDALGRRPPTPQQALLLLEKRCPALQPLLAALGETRHRLRFPGSLIRSKSSGSLEDHPLAPDLEITFEVWYEDERPLFAELSLAGAMLHRHQIERLGAELGARLSARSLLAPAATSKTERYFELFANAAEN